MKKLLILTTLSLCLVYTAHSQTSANDILRSWFINLAPAPDPAPFLLDMTARESEDKWFAPINHYDTNDLNNWWTIYFEMQHASYNPNFLPETFGLKYQSQQITKTDTIPIGILDLEYNEFRIEALRDSGDYFGWDDNGFWDIPGRINHTYQENLTRPHRGTKHDLFVIAPLKATSDFKDVVFKIDPSFIFYGGIYNDETKLPPTHTVEINLGDGSGWQQFNPSQVKYFNATYPKDGEYVIEVRVRADFDIRYSQARFGVLTDKVRKNPDELITGIPGINAGIYYPCNIGPDFEKIVIAVSGYDFGENKDIPDIYEQLIAESQIMMLHNYGYAVVVVDFGDSKKKVQDNAQSLIALIEHLKCTRSQYIHHNFTIASISLGSVITRYALATMETPSYKAAAASNINICHPEQGHNVRTWLALETENEGAIIPLAGQSLIEFAHNKIGDIDKISSHRIQDMFRKLDWAYSDLLQRDATKQLLMFHVDSTDYNGHFYRHTLGVQLQSELDALGYPQECKTVALSNALTDGKKQVAFVDIPAYDGIKYLDLDMEFSIRILKIFKLNHKVKIDLKAPDPNTILLHDKIMDVEIQYPGIYNSPGWCLVRIMAGVVGCLQPPPLVAITCPAGLLLAMPCLFPDYIYGSKSIKDAIPHGIMQGSAIHYAEMVHQPRSINGIVHAANGSFQAAFGVPGLTLGVPVASFGFSQFASPGSSSASGNFTTIIGQANLDATIITEAEAINFVPWYSALGYVRYDSLNQDLSNTPIDSNLARTPFDVIVGRQSNNYPNSTVPDNQGEQHFSHFHFRKDSVSGGPDLTFLTREIGETYQHLDNQTIDRQSWFEAEHQVNAGYKASPVWTYKNKNGLDATWSKDSGFKVTNQGYAHLKAGKQVRLQPGFSVSNGGELHAWIEPMPVCTYTKEQLDSLYNSAMVAPIKKNNGYYEVDDVAVNGKYEANTLQIDDLAKIPLQIYPNPTDGKLIIQIPVVSSYTIRTLEGKMVMQGDLTNGKNQIDIVSLRKGIYLLTIDNVGSKPYKLMKQ